MVHGLRHTASRVKHQLFPRPELAAWRHACRLAERTPRYTPGEIELDGYQLAYADLLTLCPQWRDIFVDGSMRFEARTAEPRIIDCGANIGLASLYFKRLYPQARLTAFEADPTLAGLCRRNLAANGAPDAAVEAVAVWRETGTVRFQQEQADSGAIEGTSAGLAAETIEVPAVRLRDIIAAEHVDLLKLDIEGAEHAVLPDCADALSNVDALLIDVHQFDAARPGLASLLDLLTSAGYQYAIDTVTPLPWRGIPQGPFPRTATSWAMLLRAWRSRV
jgi:FkbM family methyltransferase